MVDGAADEDEDDDEDDDEYYSVSRGVEVFSGLCGVLTLKVI
jgi:hypothetical protein